VNFAERQILLAGFSVERVVHDYGYDLLMFTYDEGGEVEAGHVLIQVRATDKLRRRARTKEVLVRIERTHLRA
jgi:hypothetical protein